MTKSENIKKAIIENWILFKEHREPTKEEKKLVKSYIEEDHINEIVDFLTNVKEDKLGLHTTCQNCGASTNL